jgi:predicted DCC family thiol-disulfide oxidoreductase YuxK
MFAPLQSYKALNGPKLPDSIPDSVVYYRNDKLYYKSRAIIYILKDLGGIWSLGYIMIIIPEFISNFFYKILVLKRYKWFGKRDKCMIPDETISSRFIT